MSWSSVTLPERERLFQLKQNGNPLEEYAVKYGMKWKTFSNRMAEYARDREIFLAEIGGKIIEAFPPIKQRKYEDQTIIETENVLISSDWEIPDVDPFMAKAQLLVAQKYGIRRLIINGDLVANDALGIGNIPPIFIDDVVHSFADQNRYTRQYIRSLRGWFTDGIHLTYGNHENKLNRRTDGAIGVDEILIGEDIEVTRYAEIWVKTSRGYAHVSHPANYSQNSVILGRKLYNVTLTPEAQTGGPIKPKFVILGHTHQSQQGHSEDGWAEIYGLGCVRDPRATAYIARKVTTYPKWSQSFLIIRNGYVEVFDKKKTNWKEVLGEELFAKM